MRYKLIRKYLMIEIVNRLDDEGEGTPSTDTSDSGGGNGGDEGGSEGGGGG